MKARLGLNTDELAEKLIPKKFGFGCRCVALARCKHLQLNSNHIPRRPTPGTGYLEALAAPNVSIQFDSIQQVVENGIKLKTGEVIQYDAIICATGFETSWRPRFPIVGRNGIDLREQWKYRPKSYLSCAIANFPNYFRRFSIKF